MIRVNDVCFTISHEGACVNIDVEQDRDDLEFVWINIKVSGGTVARVCIHGTGDVFLNHDQLQLRDI